MSFDNKTLKVGNLHIKEPMQRKFAILGGTGSGKTTSLKLTALAAMKAGIHVFIFDPLNVIRIKGFDRIVIKKSSISDPKKKKEDLIIKGRFLGKLLNQLSHKKCIIISFDNMLQNECAIFTNAVFEVWDAHDDLICIDEVHEFVPESGVSGEYAPEVERAVKHWRNKNVGFVMTSQRPAFVDKNVLALVDYLLIHRTVYPNDTDVIKRIAGGILDKEQSETMIGKVKVFSVGEYYAIDFRYME